jgi:hypothetical protein
VIVDTHHAVEVETAPEGSRREAACPEVSQGESPTSCEVATGDAMPAECAGASVEVVGETRSGRALGLALVQVSGRPWVDVFVDEAPRGRTPQVALDLEAGPRDLRFVQPALGYDCTLRLHAHAGIRYAIAVDAEMQ